MSHIEHTWWCIHPDVTHKVHEWCLTSFRRHFLQEAHNPFHTLCQCLAQTPSFFTRPFLLSLVVHQHKSTISFAHLFSTGLWYCFISVLQQNDWNFSKKKPTAHGNVSFFSFPLSPLSLCHGVEKNTTKTMHEIHPHRRKKGNIIFITSLLLTVINYFLQRCRMFFLTLLNPFFLCRFTRKVFLSILCCLRYGESTRTTQLCGESIFCPTAIFFPILLLLLLLLPPSVQGLFSTEWNHAITRGHHHSHVVNVTWSIECDAFFFIIAIQ